MDLGLLSDDLYFSRKEISNSDLSLIKESFSHFLEKDRKTVSEAMVFGKAFDQYLLREPEFHLNFIVAPEEVGKRTKVGKDLYQALAESGRNILTAQQWIWLNQMRDNVLTHPVVSNVIKESENEGSFTGILEGVEVRCKVDLLNKGWLFDLKTCQSAKRDDFKRDSASRQYHRQLSFYLDIIRQNREGILGAGIIPVEKPTTSNHIPKNSGVNIFRFDDESLEVGRYEYKKLLNKYKSHIENPGKYPGYEIEKKELKLPLWAMQVDL